jgi:peptidoglycan hydrolase CwlO-like protein
MNSLLLQVETITAEVGTLTLENKDKEGKLHECRNNNQMQRVRIEQQSLHHQSQEAPHLQADVEKLQASLNEVSASIQSIRELLETSPESVRPGLNAEIDELLEKISASTARKTALLQSMEVRKKELEKELSPLDTALTEANAALDVASTEWEGISAEHAVLSEELLKFKASLTPSQTQDSTMDTEGITADETMPDLGDSMATLTALRDTLQQSHHEVTTGKGDIVEEISTLVNEIADLGAKIRMQQELRSTKYKEQELSKRYVFIMQQCDIRFISVCWTTKGNNTICLHIQFVGGS